MTELSIPMIYERATKRTYVYTCEGDDAECPVRTLYINQDAFGANPPTAITVTITETTE